MAHYIATNRIFHFFWLFELRPADLLGMFFRDLFQKPSDSVIPVNWNIFVFVSLFFSKFSFMILLDSLKNYVVSQDFENDDPTEKIKKIFTETDV